MSLSFGHWFCLTEKTRLPFHKRTNWRLRLARVGRKSGEAEGHSDRGCQPARRFHEEASTPMRYLTWSWRKAGAATYLSHLSLVCANYYAFALWNRQYNVAAGPKPAWRRLVPFKHEALCLAMRFAESCSNRLIRYVVSKNHTLSGDLS
jgi:hypothetical protein